MAANEERNALSVSKPAPVPISKPSLKSVSSAKVSTVDSKFIKLTSTKPKTVSDKLNSFKLQTSTSSPATLELKSRAYLTEWLAANNLVDIDIIMDKEITLEKLLNMEQKDLRSLLNLQGLGTQQIERIIDALKNEREQSKSIKATHIVDTNVDLKNTNYPVWPLIIPNNCSYDPNTNKISVDRDKPRGELMAHKPTLEYIRNISSKIATISVVGRTRTGKSLVASELYAPGQIPCPFDLGHEMNACTYGVWVSAKTIKHPYQQDTVILVFDVEGTGFHQSNKHNDMQLMVITLLISSYFIYNSKGTFDASALDEIRFLLSLTEYIQSTPSEKDGQEFKKFFPIFMWLLRDVHLEPTIDDEIVSIGEYFTEKVLTMEDGFSQQIQERQYIQKALCEMFKSYDIFSLPMPSDDQYVLQQLSNLPRSELEPAFTEELKMFCDKVLQDAMGKVLFSKTANGEDQYIHCKGTHLAAWIEECIESINNPDKIPNVSSMTQSVMTNIDKEKRYKIIKEYKNALYKGLRQLRNNDDEQPLDEKDVIQLHLNTMDEILQTMDEEKGDDIMKSKLYEDICDEIGYNSDQQIGHKGIIKQILDKNLKLSKNYCDKYVDRVYNQTILPILQDVKEYTMDDVTDKIKEIEIKFYANCKGPAKTDIWQHFRLTKLNESLRNFKRYKAFNDQLLKTEEQAAEYREHHNELLERYEQQQTELLNQKQLFQELQKTREEDLDQQKRHYLSLIDAEKKSIKLQETKIMELVKNFQTSNEQISEEIMKMEQSNYKDVMSMMTIINSTLNSFRKEFGMEEEKKSDDENYPYNEFDEKFNQNGYYTLSNGNKTATFVKKGNVSGSHDYEWYPVIKISHPIDAYDTRSQMVKFRLFKPGWFGIGNENVKPDGFAGYTNCGWMIRINDGGSWYNDIGDSMGRNPIGDLTDKMVTMTYAPNTQKLTVITPTGAMYVYTHKDMPPSKQCYFIFSLNCGKVQIFD